jgi:5-methylcytosine-specific restriction endonuclease McrA
MAPKQDNPLGILNDDDRDWTVISDITHFDDLDGLIEEAKRELAEEQKEENESLLPFASYPGGGRRLTGKFLTNGPSRTFAGLNLMKFTRQTRCAYCRLDFLQYANWLIMCVDHVVPSGYIKENGINTEWEHDYANLVLACAPCNGFDNRYKPRFPPQPLETPEQFLSFRDQVFVERRANVLALRESQRSIFQAQVLAFFTNQASSS